MSDNRIIPDSTGGFHLPDGGRLTPDGMGGFHVLPGGGGGLNAGEGIVIGVMMAIFVPIAILIVIIGVPAFVTFVIVSGVLSGITQGMLGRPLSPAESSTIASQTCFVSGLLWVLVGVFVAPRILRRRE